MITTSADPPLRKADSVFFFSLWFWSFPFSNSDRTPFEFALTCPLSYYSPNGSYFPVETESYTATADFSDWRTCPTREPRSGGDPETENTAFKLRLSSAFDLYTPPGRPQSFFIHINLDSAAPNPSQLGKAVPLLFILKKVGLAGEILISDSWRLG